jgi:SAM-dependent methyltransferase
VEPQPAARVAMEKDGYTVFPYIADVPCKEDDDNFDLVTSFHVVEHLLDPVGVLRAAYNRMAVGGTCVIEVPHARDFLLDFLDLEPFKNFTLWSEHLVLHTRQSLKAILLDAGFVDVVVKGVQRYPVANHLHWLRHGKPGGHVKWSHLCEETLDAAYESMLNKLDATDTIVAYGKKR